MPPPLLLRQGGHQFFQGGAGGNTHPDGAVKYPALETYLITIFRPEGNINFEQGLFPIFVPILRNF